MPPGNVRIPRNRNVGRNIAAQDIGPAGSELDSLPLPSILSLDDQVKQNAIPPKGSSNARAAN